MNDWNDWLKNLKVGDTVVVSGRMNMFLSKVDKVTPSGRIVVNGTTYNPNGFIRSSDIWSRASLLEATPERIAEIEQNKKIEKIKSWARRIAQGDITLTTGVIDALYPLLEEIVTIKL